MKLSFTLTVISLAIIIQPVKADLISDSEQIMNDAQLVYSNFFSSSEVTQIFPPYRYRFYSGTGIYLGVNQDDEGVYLLGGPFGDSPYFVNQKDNVISLLKSQLNSNGNQNEVCDTSDIPEGFTYRFEGNTTFVTTNGQCIEVSENKNICDAKPDIDTTGNIIATGIHALSNTNVTKFEIKGIDNPIIDSVAQQLANQKTCIIHAPTEFSEHTVHSDICLDITKQVADLPGVTPPVTTAFEGTTTSSVVADCFTTDAASISNLVTKELWINQNGSFVQLQ